jgi:hypothetical protein
LPSIQETQHLSGRSKEGSMRKLSVVLALLASGWIGNPADGQEAAPGIIYSRYRHFRVPFQTGQGQQALKQLQLYVSTDQGKSWQAHALAPPEQRFFQFMTDRDGLYWFTVQTQDHEGRLFPATLDGAQPSLKVIIDTQPPVIVLQALAPRGNEAGVSWDIRDENLDLTLPDALQLDYRRGGSGPWLPLPRPPSGSQMFWSPQTNAPLQVRLRARDRAGNWGEATTTVSLGGGQDYAGGPEAPEVFQGPRPEERKLVNSKRISLNFELKEVGPSGVSLVELWFTQDGKSWNKYPHNITQEGSPRPFVFDVNGEGLYGITLVARSGVGLGLRPPQLGDRPQLWIEVDLTRPVVQIQGVVVGEGTDKGKLFITWAARDKNMGRQPITIAYAEQQAGPWTTIVERQANLGRHVWTMPERLPYQFYVKVEAVDLAGNVGTAVTPQLVKVDLSQPRVHILNVEPARPGAGAGPAPGAASDRN